MHPLFAADAITIKHAGVDKANGVYIRQGEYNKHPLYVKDNCQIRYKGCRSKWVIMVDDTALYKNFNDSEICPLIDWQITCASSDSLRLPVLSAEKQDLKNR